MNTGAVENWNGSMLDLGPLYPFVGWEVAMVVVLVIALVAWYVAQIRMESRHYDSQARMLREGSNLQRACQAERSPERM